MIQGITKCLLYSSFGIGVIGLGHAWLKPYLTNRHHLVTVGKHKPSTAAVALHVLQGSVFGSLLIFVCVCVSCVTV